MIKHIFGCIPVVKITQLSVICKVHSYSCYQAIYNVNYRVYHTTKHLHFSGHGHLLQVCQLYIHETCEIPPHPNGAQLD